MKAKADFNRILIALDGGSLDEKILRYSAYVLQNFTVEHIFLVHVSKNLSLPTDLIEKYPDLLAPKEEHLEKYLMELYRAEFSNKYTEDQVVCLEGEAFDQILRQAHIKDIDLMILGRHLTNRDHNLIGSRLAEQGPCSVLFVPEGAVSEINEILVPLDFSEVGLESLNFATHLSYVINADLQCIHLYPSAPHYLKNASSEREIKEALRSHSIEEWKTYREKHQIPDTVKCDFYENQGDGPERCLFQAEYLGADLIVMNSKGRTASASVLLGSFSKELVRINKHIPLLILKTKRENLNFFKALEKLWN